MCWIEIIHPADPGGRVWIDRAAMGERNGRLRMLCGLGVTLLLEQRRAFQCFEFARIRVVGWWRGIIEAVTHPAIQSLRFVSFADGGS